MKSSTVNIGTFYCCATPIGNLSDASFRLIDILKSVDLILAEDTRITTRLCAEYSIETPKLSLQKFNEAKQIQPICQKLLSGQSMALVSDAGTPAISDPGAKLIHAIANADIPIVPIPGPSAPTTLYSVSGCESTSYTFLGFLPKSTAQLESLYTEHRNTQLPLIAFESPNRLLTTIELLTTLDPTARLTIGKELTKSYETIIRGTPADCKSQLTPIPIKGEWSLVIKPSPIEQDTDAIITKIKTLNLDAKTNIKIATTLYNLPKNRVYNAFHDH